LSLLSI